MKDFKHSLLYISGIGISNLGNWIYLVAINLLVLEMTGSAAAVAGLFIIRPLASLLTNTWSGSLIDRLNNRKLMITMDCIRGVLVAIIPFLTSIWSIYAVMFLINIATSFFGPTSSTYIAKLIPAEKRKRFNSAFSFTNSGAFLLGPSIAGILITYTNFDVCIFVNAASFFVCVLAIYFLPDVDRSTEQNQKALGIQTLIQDWAIVIRFSGRAKYFMFIYLFFQVATLLLFAVDSQEVTFIKKSLGLRDSDFGLLVTITGSGYLAGSLAATILSNRLSLRLFIGLGMIFTGIGYTVFYASSGFVTAAVGFIILGFFSSFANSGYTTFLQNNVPIDIMGRFSSITNFIQGLAQIALTLLLGMAAEIISLQAVCLAFTAMATFLSAAMCIGIFLPSKTGYYETKTKVAM